jgi:hypothetical protein
VILALQTSRIGYANSLRGKGRKEARQAHACMQGVSEFLLQALCSSAGNIRGLLVLGHSDSTPFALDSSAGWAHLHELLSFVLYEALAASSLVRFTMFAELLQLVPRQADAVLFMDRWLPAVLVGERWLQYKPCCVVVSGLPDCDRALPHHHKIAGFGACLAYR